MMKRKIPPIIHPFSKLKPMETERKAPPEEPYWKKLPKPIVFGLVTLSVISLPAFGVLALSDCGALRVQLNPFELQLTKVSCTTPPDQYMK